MERSFKAYFTLYITLPTLLRNVFKTNSVIESILRDGTKLVAMHMYDCRTLKKEEIQIQHRNLLKLIEDTDFINLQIFDNQLSNQD